MALERLKRIFGSNIGNSQAYPVNAITSVALHKAGLPSAAATARSLGTGTCLSAPLYNAIQSSPALSQQKATASAFDVD